MFEGVPAAAGGAQAQLTYPYTPRLPFGPPASGGHPLKPLSAAAGGAQASQGGLSRLFRIHAAARTGAFRSPYDPGRCEAPAISLRGVSYSYDKGSFIEGLDLDIPRGCVTSIVGPNGCGKSTLLKLMDGLLVPREGDVLIDGKPGLAMGKKERARHLSLLVQAAKVPAMSVEALVACGRYPYQSHLHQATRRDKEHVDEAMRLVGVDRFRHHDVRFLSGGERQRVFIAMTLAQDTGIIALDEPTTYLDVHACHEIMQLVCRLNHEAHKTILMVIHDLDLALRYSDHMVVMEKGRCICTGGVDEVFESGALTQAFQMEVCRTISESDSLGTGGGKEGCKGSSASGRIAYTLFPLQGKDD
ncbi:MAG: ABC transporter ATP-binding protein [Coriobacteriaceae bacterium]|jgi:iron complex transport system ATP-binding protein|nr:ABC transporter ATP-binding protein [Coriobacteriaceae bacterium]